MIINEIFYSLQGEGMLAGVPSVFIRLAGCPLRCKWCDTAYAWDADAGSEMSIEQLIDEISEYQGGFFVVTGGEPLANSHIKELIGQLRKIAGHITIETAGIQYVGGLDVDLISISPNMSNSLGGDRLSNRQHADIICKRQTLAELVQNYNCQLKFVVEQQDDILEIKQLLRDFPQIKRESVMLMPQARTQEEYMRVSKIVADLCIKNTFRFSPRLHVQFWGNMRGV